MERDFGQTRDLDIRPGQDPYMDYEKDWEYLENRVESLGAPRVTRNTSGWTRIFFSDRVIINMQTGCRQQPAMPVS